MSASPSTKGVPPSDLFSNVQELLHTFTLSLNAQFAGVGSQLSDLRASQESLVKALELQKVTSANSTRAVYARLDSLTTQPVVPVSTLRASQHSRIESTSPNLTRNTPSELFKSPVAGGKMLAKTAAKEERGSDMLASFANLVQLTDTGNVESTMQNSLLPWSLLGPYLHASPAQTTSEDFGTLGYTNGYSQMIILLSTSQAVIYIFHRLAVTRLKLMLIRVKIILGC